MIKGLTFSNTSPAFTLSSNNSSNLTTSISGITTTSNASVTFDNTINSLILSSGTQAYQVNGTGNLAINTKVANGGFDLTLNGTGTGTGSISGVISGSGGLTNSGSNTWTLSGTTSNYTGATALQNGTLSVALLANSGSNSSIGTGATNSTIALGSGTNNVTLAYTGATASTNRVLDLAGTTGNITLDASGSGALTFASALTATGAGNKTLSLSGTNTAANTITGNIVNAGANATSLIKTDTGNWVLSGTTSNYTGSTAIQNGTLSVALLANSGSNSSIGAGTTNGTIALGSGANAVTLQYTGATASTNRVIDLAGTTGNITLDASGSGALTFASNLTATGAGNKTLTLSGTNTAANTITGPIINNTGNVTSLVKNGTGNWVLSSATSNFSGSTQIQNGTLSVGTLANSGTVSSLGNGTVNSTIAIGSTTNNGTLRYTGAVTSTNRVIDLAGTTGNATLDASGSGALTFSSNLTATGLGNKTLILTGTSTAANTVSGAIVNSTGNVTSVYKDGSGTWVLSGNSSYTGNTTINLGTIKLGATGGGANGPLGTTAGNTVVNSGGALDLAGFTLATAEPLSITGNGVSSGGALTNSGSAATFSGNVSLTGNASIGGAGNITLSGAFNDLGVARTITKAGASTLNLTGNATSLVDGTAVNITNGNLYSNAATALGSLANVTIAGATGSSFGLGANQTIGALNGVNTSASDTVALGAYTLTVGSTNNLSGTYNGAINGAGGIIKNGTGNLTLGGDNSFGYFGGTTVNNGVLLGTDNTANTFSTIGGFTSLGNFTSATANNILGITVNTGGTLAVAETGTISSPSGSTALYQTLVLNGTGYNNNGALLAQGGNNTWVGNVSLGSNTTIRNTAAFGANNTLFLGPYFTDPGVQLKLNNNTLTFGGTGDVYISENVGNSSGDTGSVVFSPTSANTTYYFAGVRDYYTGNTTVNAGRLRLLINPGNNYDSAILGSNLTIGTGSGVGAQVFIDKNNQIGNTTTVTINSDGTLRFDQGTLPADDYLGKVIMNGGSILTGSGHMLMANGVAGDNLVVGASTGTSTISGSLDMNNAAGGATRTINVGSGSTLLVSANLLGGNFIKTGTGTMTMNYDNQASGYNGGTEVSNGILNIQNSGALGAGNSSALSNGTIVDSGATLQLENAGSNITVAQEALTLNGSGYTSLGALESKVGGNNSWNGTIHLGSNATINTDSGSVLTVGGSVIGTASANVTQVLTAGGAGNTTYAGPITNGSNGGTVALTKADAGVVTLTGSNTFSGAINVNTGTLKLNANGTIGVTNTNAVNIASGATLEHSSGTISGTFTNKLGALTGNGTISIGTYATAVLNLSNSGTDTFDGKMVGIDATSIFDLNNSVTGTAGTLTLTNGTTNFLGLLKVERGELDFSSTASGSTYANMTVGNSSTTTTLKLNNATINVGTLHITGNTILDFGTSGASILSATNIYIDSGYTLTVQNWDSEVDFLYALTDFRLNSSGGTLAAYNAIGPVPEDLVLFPGTNSANGSNTTWTNNSYYAVVNASGNYVAAQNKEIRPVPEPSTYGAIFLGASLALLGYRRYRQKRSLVKVANF